MFSAIPSDRPGGDPPPIVAILGPTGVGKSQMALSLCERFGGEIISADSRQVYRHLDIGTAKPSHEEQLRVSHHVIDLVDPDHRYSVVEFCRDATRALGAISANGRIAFVVGGTGYYARALLEGMSFPLDLDSDVSGIESVLREVGTKAAVNEIARIDSEFAARLDRSNARRVARALAWVRSTGEPFPKLSRSPRPALVLGLTERREELYRKLDDRVESQIDAGLPEEAQLLIDMGFDPDLPVMRGLAYGQMIPFLRGKWTLVEAIHAYKNATHSLVRRQMTWFRNEPRLEWLNVSEPLLELKMVRRIERFLEANRGQRI